MTYRPEIDGLRAIAVISVLIYHYFPNVLRGGFVGVDIFFVISGFLITSIILSEYRNDKFSFKGFYTRRIKRILPPIWPVIIFSTLVAAAILPDDSYTSYAWSSVTSILFTANHYFAYTFNYFGALQSFGLLLHFWSLSVEEQFYILWPFLLLIIVKIKLTDKTKLLLLSLVALFSFLGAHLMSGTTSHDRMAFYLLPARSGELLVGCILAIYQQSSIRKYYNLLLGYFGVALIVGSTVFITRYQTFPGFLALVPTLGTALTISQFKNDSVLYKKILSASPMIYVGKISYSLYLWHWPLLFAPIYLLGSLKTSTLLVLIAASLVMAHLSWKLIEQPIRKNDWSFRKSLCVLYLIPFGFILILLQVRPAIIGSIDISQTLEDQTKHPPFCFGHRGLNDCKLGDMNKIQNAIMFGDSHAAHYRPFWDSIGKNINIAIDAYAVQTCYPLINFENYKPSIEPSIKDKVNCLPHIEFISGVFDRYDIVILAASWVIYADSHDATNANFLTRLENQIIYLENLNKKVILMAQVPWYLNNSIESRINISNIPHKALKNWVKDVNNTKTYPFNKSVSLINTKLKNLASRYSHVYYLDPIENAFEDKHPSPYFEDKLLYANGDHLSVFGSLQLANAIVENPVAIDELRTHLSN